MSLRYEATASAGVEIPTFSNFDFFENVDAIFAAVAITAFGQVCKPFFPTIAGRESVQSRHHDRHHKL